jgi:beta-fructofuranosidase
VSNFSQHGLLGSQYECSNMVEMPMENATDPMYLMYISINPGAPLGGSISQYFPGTFNGTHFTAIDGAAHIADLGKDHYAGRFFYGIPGDRPQVSVDRASNWEYTNYVPTGPLEGWQSTMSLPRINYLANVPQAGYDLISALSNICRVPSSPLAHNNTLENGTLLVDFSDVASNAVYLEMNIASLNRTALSNTRIRQLYLLIFSDIWKMLAVFDRSIFEVFLLGGEQKATITIFPEYALDTLIAKTAGLNMGAKVGVAAWAFEGGWKVYENATGTVVENVTMDAKGDNGSPSTLPALVLPRNF